MESLPEDTIRQTVQLALAEDVGPGDVTTLATVPEAAMAAGSVVAREHLVVAGIELAECTFRELSTGVVVRRLAEDGTHVVSGQSVLHVRGSARAILTAERVALNFLQRLCGIATLTDSFVRAVEGTAAKILDTRKTTPGWRHLEKYAVRCGGGVNHRFGLFDRVLIKDNHLAAVQNEAPNAIAAAVRRARASYPKLIIEVEADTIAQVRQALEAGADIILLDNMNMDQLRDAVREIDGRAQSEASGGVSLATVRSIAETGVDFISVGALTHSARAMDLALDFA